MSNPFHSKNKRDKWVSFVQSLNPNIDPKALRLMDEMRVTARTLHHLGESSITASGLSYAKYRLLMGLLLSEEIEDRGELNPSEISERQGTSRNSVSALIRNLEDDGLVERSLDLEDRRKFNIKLTEAGRTLVQEHVRKHFRIIGRCFSALDDDEQEELSKFLSKIRLGAKAETEAGVEATSVRTGA